MRVFVWEGDRFSCLVMNVSRCMGVSCFPAKRFCMSSAGMVVRGSVPVFAMSISRLLVKGSSSVIPRCLRSRKYS